MQLLSSLRGVAVVGALAGTLALASPTGAVERSGNVREAAPAAVTRYISNENSIGIGVSRYVVGSPSRPYDAILPGHQRTDTALGWETAASWYLGPGYCGETWKYQDGAWRFSRGDRGPIVIPVGDIPGQSVDRWAARYIAPC
ncbi:hypothetical protein [Streptomyces lincolnensis]|nr:hypothetical protein [Streptomyces lincolnensis]